LFPNSIFVLGVDDDSNMMEFVYPKRLNGNIIPINIEGILGRAVISKRYYITNNAKKDKDLGVLNYLMSIGSLPIQKLITYPIEFANKIVAVLEVVRRGDSLTEAPDFGVEDIDRIGLIIRKFFKLHAAESA